KDPSKVLIFETLSVRYYPAMMDLEMKILVTVNGGSYVVRLGAE
ncbi:hypothetical protein CMV_022848, partial [Castanea mollissima]